MRELTAYLKRLLERDELLQEVVVRGEISNFTRHSSGHLYFSLKDEDATLSCVCFRGSAAALKFDPDSGQRVIAFGSITVYEKRGNYQLVVRFMQPDGQGDLAAAFAALKEKLEQEGLFAVDRKRPLPRFPRGIGLVTSPTGAAVRDMVSILGRRYPLARVVIFPTVVQGADGAASIVTSLQRANRHPGLDVIIVGRGGGSLEDLWCFNEESVARAVFASRLPVVSAVGHETDVALTDFVADVRAATPSAAAELVAPDAAELLRHVEALGRGLAAGLQGHLARWRHRLQVVASHPLLQRPDMVLQGPSQRLDDAAVGLAAGLRMILERKQVRLEKATVQLAALSPLAVLGRGYAIVRTAPGDQVVRSRTAVAAGQGLRITVEDGDFGAVAE